MDGAFKFKQRGKKKDELNGRMAHVTEFGGTHQGRVCVHFLQEKMFNSGSRPFAGFALNVFRYIYSIFSLQFGASFYMFVSL